MPRFRFIERNLYKKAKVAQIDWEVSQDPVDKLRADNAKIKYLQYCRQYKIEPQDL